MVYCRFCRWLSLKTPHSCWKSSNLNWNQDWKWDREYLQIIKAISVLPPHTTFQAEQLVYNQRATVHKKLKYARATMCGCQGGGGSPRAAQTRAPVVARSEAAGAAEASAARPPSPPCQDGDMRLWHWIPTHDGKTVKTSPSLFLQSVWFSQHMQVLWHLATWPIQSGWLQQEGEPLSW